jgi:hypothetical protein
VAALLFATTAKGLARSAAAAAAAAAASVSASASKRSAFFDLGLIGYEEFGHAGLQAKKAEIVC